MGFETKCTFCGKILLADNNDVGKEITCWHCSRETLVKEPTEIERATKEIRAELRSLKGYLALILIALVVITVITVMFYRDYCKLKEGLRDSLPKISDPYKEREGKRGRFPFL